ncbi:hypothetical protein GJ698_02220 [Pseudoduganella sp. FT26W]|jgi:hypothetical protein|uniref:Uncharacterized protein n=1 Tax=Duganella aquatilis TaxID=2666082 RepID=A0A844CZG7_9BURK|nr:hypothetical protein [Duganella aquatilis]MRW82905.1 hypothetical protein [Duganella aquatilis]
MLHLDEERRSDLLDKGALTVGADGDEVLVGLSLAESHFYLMYEENPIEAHDTGETALYLQLKHKHLAARGAALLNASEASQITH